MENNNKKENILKLTAQFFKDVWLTEKKMEKENIEMLMDQLIKVIGWMIKEMAKENINLLIMGHPIMDNGKIIREMDKVIINLVGIHLFQFMMEILMIGKIMGKESNVIQMNQPI